MLQYKAKFIELARFSLHIAWDDTRKAKIFQRGLRLIICTRMAALRLNTFSEVLETTKVVEKECEDFREFGTKIRSILTLKDFRRWMTMP